MSDRSSAPGLFGTPALRRGERASRPAIHDDASAEAVRVVNVERFKLGSGTAEGSDVTLEVRGLRLRLLARAGRLVYPSLRGEPGVTIAAPGLRAEVEAVALDAAGRSGV